MESARRTDTHVDGGDPWTLPGSGQRVRIAQTVRDRVAREVRHRIFMGTLQEGARIDLDALAEEFGTSRTPIREACFELAADNLVRLAPRSGITVLGITDRDLLDNFELMASLAGFAAYWSAERADDDELVAIRQARDAVVSASVTGGDVSLANFLFHREINHASHSPRTMALIAQTARLFPERFFDAIPAQIPCSLQEHDELVAALEARDGAKARDVIIEHFQQAAGRLRHRLTELRAAPGEARRAL